MYVCAICKRVCRVLLAGTHTHSTPGGVGGTALVDITTLGFIKHNFQAAVAGIVLAIQRALADVQAGDIKVRGGGGGGAG